MIVRGTADNVHIYLLLHTRLPACRLCYRPDLLAGHVSRLHHTYYDAVSCRYVIPDVAMSYMSHVHGNHFVTHNQILPIFDTLFSLVQLAELIVQRVKICLFVQVGTNHNRYT